LENVVVVTFVVHAKAIADVVVSVVATAAFQRVRSEKKNSNNISNQRLVRILSTK
jgi:hypothetical protein